MIQELSFLILNLTLGFEIKIFDICRHAFLKQLFNLHTRAFDRAL